MMNVEQAKAGFEYLVEVVKDGVVIDAEVVHNLMPVEGINHLLSVGLLGGSQVAQWYVSLYENDYAPQPTDVAATFPALAGESTAYTSATRVPLLPGTPAGGVSDNATNKAEFEFTATKTIRGGAIQSVGTKGGTAGVLLSAVRFASPKQVESGAVLRVTAGLQITSA